MNNFPYAYRNLQESFNELVPHLKRNGLKVPKPLRHRISYVTAKETSRELQDCIIILKEDESQMHNCMFLEQKLTKLLLERFIVDAEYFINNIDREMAINIPFNQDAYLDN